MPSSEYRRAAPSLSPRPLSILTTTITTLYVLLVHGYHPYAEDGGLYVAGIKKLLNPSLFPTWTAFVTEHLRFSLFAPLVAGLVRLTHLPLPAILLILYLAGVWFTLNFAGRLASYAFTSREGRCGAVTLLAGALATPIAGTSLILSDPYLTARSLSTPLVLAALAWTLECRVSPATRNRSAFCAVAALIAATILHPLMAGYGFAAVLVLIVTTAKSRATRLRAPWLLLGAALLIATILQLQAPPETANYTWVAMTRYYWFPFCWEWYEQLGLIAPLAVLGLLSRRTQNSTKSEIARSAILLGLISLTVSILFCRAGLPTHLVARLQPLRSYQIVYELMLLLLGGWLGEHLLRRKPWRWAVLLAALGGLMFFVERSTYPASDHLELPGRTPRNSWSQAFLWSRDNTSVDALFALDAHYITRDGEDAQTFRAIAERSALPDYSKDGGEASITPALTPAWVQGQAAQTDLDHESDAERLTRLQGLGVTWIILEARSPTALTCPYQNQGAKVCHLPG